MMDMDSVMVAHSGSTTVRMDLPMQDRDLAMVADFTAAADFTVVEGSADTWAVVVVMVVAAATDKQCFDGRRLFDREEVPLINFPWRDGSTLD